MGITSQVTLRNSNNNNYYLPARAQRQEGLSDSLDSSRGSLLAGVFGREMGGMRGVWANDGEHTPTGAESE